MIIRKLTVVVAVLSVVFGGVSSFAKESQHGSFTFVENKDDFDDSDRSIIFTASESSTRGAALSWRCMSDGLNVVYMLMLSTVSGREWSFQFRHRTSPVV